jgi:hypothetical protein
MVTQENKIKYVAAFFVLIVLASSGLLISNIINYFGLLESTKKVSFSIDEMYHREENGDVEVSIHFTLLNPTSYPRLRFSSLQCQLYIIVGAEETYLATTGYAPPVEIPLRHNEAREYVTKVSISKRNIMDLTDGTLDEDLIWRVRNVVHYSTPIRSFYQNIHLNQTSSLQS